jgi:hypothetical protein
MHNPPQLLLPLNKLARLPILHESRHLHYDEVDVCLLRMEWPHQQDGTIRQCLRALSLLLSAYRQATPRDPLPRDIVLFGLYLRLGQLLVPDGTVMLALMRLGPGSAVHVEVLKKRLPLPGFFCLWMTPPLDYLDLVSVEQ